LRHSAATTCGGGGDGGGGLPLPPRLTEIDRVGDDDDDCRV
jgi:hypothetical protein